MLNKLFIIVLIIIGLYSDIFGQISIGGTPRSFSVKTRSEVPVIQMPFVDNDSMVIIEKQDIEDNQPLRFAKTFDVDINLNNSGKWDTLSNGDKMWRLAITSPNAYSINLIFSTFNLPQGSQLFIYNNKKDYILGAFGAHNNRPNHILPIAPVESDFVIIEYIEPQSVEFNGELAVGTIGHDYKGLFLFPNKSANEASKAQPCQVNINCPEGKDWQIEKHSVVKIIVNAREMCTGVLVNNSRNDGAPYLLTANHCLDEDNPAGDAPYTIAIFNYENDDCAGNTGPLNQTLSGAELLATAPDNLIDFALLKFIEIPPSDYYPYFAGWDRRNNSPTSSTAIHHPDGDIKKITFDYDKSETGTFTGYEKNTHWKVKEWDLGVTEKGSSGCPLFNEAHRVIGTLTGGMATCDSPVNDYFSKISFAWETYPASNNSLKQWLDPTNSGINYLDGFDPYVAMLDYNACIYKVYVPENEYCEIEPIVPEVLLINKGKQILTNVSVKYQVNDNQIVDLKWEGQLSPNKSIALKLNKSAINEGQNVFKVWTELPNGHADQDCSNDTLKVIFNANYGKQYLLNLYTDRYGQETSWKLYNNLQETVYEGDNYLDENFQNQKLCLKEGCYTFSVFDREKDGMCCYNGDGGYTLVDATSKAQIFRGGKFTDQENNIFCFGVERDSVDIQAVEIISPKDKYCQATEITPALIIRNFGKSTITNATILCMINDTLTLQKEWTGTLLPDSLATITFNKIQLPLGVFNLNFIVNLPETISETAIENNKKSINVIVSEGQVVELEIKTDNYGSEITWELSDDNNNFIDYGGPYRDGKELVKVKKEYCLDEMRCYTFTIYDKHGDGLCCSWMGDGYYKLKNKSSGITVLQGDEFGAQAKGGFCLFPVEIQKVNNEFPFKIYPNPGQQTFTVESSVNEHFNVEITTITGQSVLKESITSNKTFDISRWAKGIYLINIQSNAESFVRKFVKE